MPITPDDKDWTWVLATPCPECGFDARHHPRATLGSTIRENAVSWASVLREPAVSMRTSGDRWSPLEYACHVRDVYRIFDGRLHMMLQTDNPTFENWDQDDTAQKERYDLQDRFTVAAELTAAATTIAQHFDEVREEEWARPGLRSNGSHFTVESLGTYLVHDPIHHLWDVRGPSS